jgi:hypothetical protein
MKWLGEDKSPNAQKACIRDLSKKSCTIEIFLQNERQISNELEKKKNTNKI